MENKLKAITSTFLLAASAALSLHAQTAQPYQGVVGRTLAESKEWWPEPVKAPANAPNVVWILLDDVGYGAPSTFGGAHSDAYFRHSGEQWFALHELPYGRDLRPHPRRAFNRPEQRVRA